MCHCQENANGGRADNGAVWSHALWPRAHIRRGGCDGETPSFPSVLPFQPLQRRIMGSTGGMGMERPSRMGGETRTGSDGSGMWTCRWDRMNFRRSLGPRFIVLYVLVTVLPLPPAGPYSYFGLPCNCSCTRLSLAISRTLVITFSHFQLAFCDLAIHSFMR